jgi:hypothetical protein
VSDWWVGTVYEEHQGHHIHEEQVSRVRWCDTCGIGLSGPATFCLPGPDFVEETCECGDLGFHTFDRFRTSDLDGQSG